ncbi:hypothetical protein [Phyllobacterium phragmitis]|uniref:Uncharacterized protein n=1 Tax=Phyllobacterium phragmitis TaxID=2670329 RepID=A0ABQ0GUK6_9HYPH
MTEITHEEIEGRLIAQREILGFMLALLARREDVGEPFWNALEERATFQNQQEDPGVLPTRAFAAEAAMMREFRLIVDEARARFNEAKGKDRNHSQPPELEE